MGTSKAVAAPVAKPAMPLAMTPAYWDDACKHLSRRDRVMKKLIPKFGETRLASRGDTYFTGGPYGNNTYYLFNKNYLRVKNIEIGYSISSGLRDKVGLRDLRIYFNALNLLTFDKHKVFDPETESQSGVYYPQARVLNLGFNLSF